MQTRVTLASIAVASTWAAGAAGAQPVQLIVQSRTVEVTSTSYGNLWDEAPADLAGRQRLELPALAA